MKLKRAMRFTTYCGRHVIKPVMFDNHIARACRWVCASLISGLSLVCMLWVLTGYNSAEANIGTDNADDELLPHLVAQIDGKPWVNQAAIHPDGRIFFLSDDTISIVDGLAVEGRITLPNFSQPYEQHLKGISIDPHSGLAYAIEGFADLIHVVNNTTLITTIHGVVDQPRTVVADEDSGKMYIFYTSQKSGKPQSYATVLSGTEVITDMVLPISMDTARYSPADGHIYIVGYPVPIIEGSSRENALVAIDNHQVITTIRPLDTEKPGLAIVDMAINPATGDVYILLATRVIYWDRVHLPKSVDFYESGYRNAGSIVVDPQSGRAYVSFWMAQSSHVLVFDQDQFVADIPVARWPYAMAVDAKHDYIYVAHQDPTKLSVIRGTELITTLDVIGFGASNVIVDETRDYVYVVNTGDGNINVFGYQDEISQPAWFEFLPFLRP
jgi:DNA-binding beta-propeller fold protein YncE